MRVGYLIFNAGAELIFGLFVYLICVWMELFPDFPIFCSNDCNQGTVSMIRTDSIRRSLSSEPPEGAEIVYTKDNVTIHPTQFASERIGGRLKLIKQGNALFMVLSFSFYFLFLNFIVISLQNKLVLWVRSIFFAFVSYRVSSGRVSSFIWWISNMSHA